MIASQGKSVSSLILLSGLSVLTLSSLACTPNYNRSLVEHSIGVYDDSLARYNEMRGEYFDLLESLEIASDEKYLQKQRRELKRELETRELELSNMQVLIDEEITQWEKQVFERQQESKIIEKATEEANQRIIKQRFKAAADQLNPENYYKKKKKEAEAEHRLKRQLEKEN